MRLPPKLKLMTVFLNGVSYLGETTEVTLPKLTRDLQDYRPGGSIGKLKIDMGQEPIEFEHKYGGFMRGIMRQYAVTAIDGVQLRFVGAYQSEDDGTVGAVEITVRGRHSEIDPGKAKSGDDTEFAAKTACVYYKQTFNGETDVEIDFLNGKCIVAGVDRMAELMAAIGGGAGGGLDALMNAGPGLPQIPTLGDFF